MRKPSKSEPTLPENLTGSLLLAKPGMPDPNFRRTVVLLSAHSKEGALGVIVNRAAGLTIGGLQSDLADGPFSDIPVLDGGPVQRDRLILAAWHSSADAKLFKFYFGLDPEKLQALREADPALSARAFRGYAGWSAGQLEAELAREDWIVHPVDPERMAKLDGVELWKSLVGGLSPAHRLSVDLPDDPSLN